MTSTICAPSTPSGGALGIIRVSGPQSIPIADVLFTSPSHQLLVSAKGQTLHFGTITDSSGAIIDEVLLSLFRAPHSYTGEDSIEISCHGSRFIMNAIIERLIQLGCQQAQPGEFTQRAFLNGKLDLSQAEAVADLIASNSRATHHMALSQLRGHFSSELSQLREQLLKLTSLLELELDFSDHEDLEFADRSELLQLTENINTHITRLIRSFRTGKAIKQGIPVAIIGKTNVGKSTLLNQLLHDERAIVSNIHGTTRDVIEDTIDINGVTFRFIDTAGIRKTTDAIETLGIERTYKKISEATIILWVIDQQPTPEEFEEIQRLTTDKSLIIIRNKIDQLTPSLSPATLSHSECCDATESSPSLQIPSSQTNYQSISISAKHGTGISQLEEVIYDAAHLDDWQESSTIVTHARHYEALLRAQESLTRVQEGLHLQLSGDLLAEDLRIALSHLGDITGGTITPDETLQNIFKHFCVGK